MSTYTSILSGSPLFEGLLSTEASTDSQEGL